MSIDTPASLSASGRAVPDQAQLLDRALAQYDKVPGLVSDLKVGAGVDPSQPFAGSCHIVAYSLDPGDELFVAHLVTAAVFIHHERSPTGDTLTVVIPLRQITRVSTLTRDGQPQVTVEYDADLLTATDRTEMVTRPANDSDGDLPQGAAVSIGQVQGTTTRARYVLTGDQAAVFASRLAAAL